MLSASEFLGLCHARGFRFITGTPCSYLKPLINAAIGDPRFMFRNAVNEGDAVAMAAGAVLAGQPSIVMFQNSGLGNAVNALTSLCNPFRVPLLLLITHRGEPGGEADEPQHEQMGRITTALLDTLEIPWVKFPDNMTLAAETLAEASARMAKTERPFAFVLSKGAIAPFALKRTPAEHVPLPRSFEFSETFTRPARERATRTEALRAVLAARKKEEVLIATTGYTGRELYALGDEPWNLYMVGSMGSASAFALGLSMQMPERPVTVIDGDGAALMRMGNFAALGAYGSSALRHVVLDNEAHDSTGGQATLSPGVSFAAVAQACGYGSVFSTDDPAAFARALLVPCDKGPTLIHFRTAPGAPEHLPRPTVAPAEVFRRLQRWLKSEA
jgi:phosphonopyruvate decarboxylase